MTPNSAGEFTKDLSPRLKDPRRKRWAETYGLLLASVGGAVELLAILLEQVARPDNVTIFPASWHPYIRGAAIALGVVALSEKRERQRDYRRYVERQREREQQQQQQQATPLPRRFHNPPPNAP